MNGVHDMGGMHGFGPVPREEDEPVFHAPWEGRLFGITRAVGSHDIHSPRGMRFALESMDPARYLSSSYYERWLHVTEKALLSKGLLTAEELDARTEFFAQRPDAVVSRREDPAMRDLVMRTVRSHLSPHRDVGVTPRFQPGDRVAVRNIHPQGHTRLPRYVRGKHGAIVRVHGIHDFQDTVPEGAPAQPQAVYNVRFDARELWGESAEENQTVHLDMWESHLDPT